MRTKSKRGGEEKYPKNFVSKLTDSDTEATETTVRLDFALHFGYLTSGQHKTLSDHYDHICSQLTIDVRAKQVDTQD